MSSTLAELINYLNTNRLRGGGTGFFFASFASKRLLKGLLLPFLPPEPTDLPQACTEDAPNLIGHNKGVLAACRCERNASSFARKPKSKLAIHI
jgi:hypothetical protein